MKFVKVLIAISCFFALLCLVRCCSSSSSDNHAKEQIAQDSVVPEEQIAQDSVIEVADQKSYVEYKHTYKDAKHFSFSVDYKIDSSLTGVNEKILEELVYIATKRRNTDFLSSAKAYADSLYKGYKSQVEDGIIEEEFNYEYTNEVEISNVYDDSYVLSVCVNHSSFEGGAHGNYCSTYYVFNLKTGKQYHLSDLIEENAKENVSSLIVDYFVKENKLNKPEELLEVGFFDLKDIKVTENFFVNKEGVSFVYCPYVIACYANGTQTAFLDWGKWNKGKLIKSGSPFACFIKEYVLTH